MAVIRYKNQTEYAFLVWMKNYPESFHPLDMRRFYVFAKSVARFRCKRWLDYSYFEDRVLKHTSHFSKENIDLFWDKLTELVEFHQASPMPVIDLETSSTGETRPGTYQRGVKDGRFYEVKISDEEYFSGGASKETLKKAKLF
ncbi:hypothetical protein KO465_06160 [Candidatus Micrarchaeota archaeon]|nr:hypothetical protein [Candidatus Micrarchaeota archaeon]